MGKSMETESRLAVVKGGREAGMESANGYRVSFGGNENVPK